VPNSNEDLEVSMLTTRPVLKPVPAITGLLELFATHPLVALGEIHMLQDEADFIAALLHHPAFPATVQVIVVEFGNARYQSVMDRFIGGEPIAARDLRPVWRDIFGLGFDAPIYEQFFRTVRAINRTLPPDQRLRVLLGDPPIDWSQITQAAQVRPWVEQRDAYYAGVVETNILAPGYHGLLIAGLAHFLRDSPMPFPLSFPLEGTTGHRIERNHPHNLHVIMPHTGFGPETSALEPYLADWPIPSLISLSTGWLGELDAALVHEGKFIFNPDIELPPLKQGVTLGAMADSYLYLGPRSSLTRSTANPAIYRGDEPYLSELHRRHSVGFLPIKNVLTEGDPRFFPD
jgi:hypothetical protein